MDLSIGTIVLWESGTIPSGWQLCDGTNGTPDLRGSFMRCAVDDSDLLETGGATAHTHTNPDTGIRANHSHTATVNTATSSSDTYYTGTSYTSAGVHSHAFADKPTSSNNSHSHTLGITGNSNNIPPYIFLYYIMKIS